VTLENTTSSKQQVAAVAIGRNEGERLVACLDALQEKVTHIIYVDSGSSDDSVAAATARGAEVVNLDMRIPFTAARARNAGVARLKELGVQTTAIQFIDGDCILQDGWIETGSAFLDNDPGVAAVCGRNRERFPEHSIYNWLADREWDTPVGKAKATGGNVMIRLSAFEQVGGFDENLIAGEEPELCVRLRAAGWTIWRLDAEMTLHDTAMTQFRQWWKRTRRGGYAFANGHFLHGAPPEQHYARETRSAIVWGGAIPAGILLLAALVSPWCLLGFLVFPLQALRLLRKGFSLTEAAFLTLGKFPEAIGVVEFHAKRLLGQRSTLIEYK